MASTHLLNSVERCVDDLLEGVVAAHPGILLIPEQRTLYNRELLTEGGCKKLALVSGGGSGHEPFPAGYIGRGMLGAAVSGPIFTSPPPGPITNAIAAMAKNNPVGVLVIVFNYTGDRVNFGIAVERCKAAGMKVEMFINGEDCAITKIEGSAGRRGMCGGIFLYKMIGAMAEAGASMEEALATSKKIASGLGTLGVAASGCTLPGSKVPLFEVSEGNLELGLGVHGECGAKSIKVGTAQEIVQIILDHMTREDSETRLDLQKGDEVAVMINNLGSVTHLEMAVITKEVAMQLKKRDVNPVRIYQGHIETSLNMKGFQVAILRLLDPNWINLLDAPTAAFSWPKTCSLSDIDSSIEIPSEFEPSSVNQLSSEYVLENPHEINLVKSSIEAVVNQIPQYEQMLNHLDYGAGDGDCGTTLSLGIKGLNKKLSTLPFNIPNQLLNVIGEIAAYSMGGTSGGLYAILFTAAASNILSPKESGSHRQSWAAAFKAGCEAVTKYGGASLGDRTMLDALLPAIDVLENKTTKDLKTLWKAMADAADEGAKKTAHMKARAGRATYVRAERVTEEDPGARSVACVLRAISDSIGNCS